MYLFIAFNVLHVLSQIFITISQHHCIKWHPTISTCPKFQYSTYICNQMQSTGTEIEMHSKAKIKP